MFGFSMNISVSHIHKIIMELDSLVITKENDSYINMGSRASTEVPRVIKALKNIIKADDNIFQMVYGDCINDRRTTVTLGSDMINTLSKIASKYF